MTDSNTPPQEPTPPQNSGDLPGSPGTGSAPISGGATHSATPANPGAQAPSRKASPAIISLVVVVALLAIALVIALIRPWDKGDTSDSTGDATAGGPSPSVSSSAPASQTETPSPLQVAETEIAKEKGWVAGTDYVPSLASPGWELALSVDEDGDTGLTRGPAEAPVTVHVFGDFSCPLCTRLHKESMADLEKMADAGQIRLMWHNFVIFSDYGSDKAARGTVAAAKQGKLWEFIAAAYDSAGEGNHPTYTDETVEEIAQRAGIPDMDQFRNDYTSDETANAVTAQTDYARNTLGLTGTPNLIVRGSFLNGAYPTNMIINTIEMQTELAARGF
ncbi:MAG: hypothetical protein E7Z96_10185 [Actinomycetaceae bacterium]|nr:hypothetical protein [Actinomycetaceae bacterium]